MRILQSSDFLTDLNDFLREGVFLDKCVFDEFSEDRVGLDEFECLVFEVDRGILRVEILNFWDFEFGRIGLIGGGIEIDKLFGVCLPVMLLMVCISKENTWRFIIIQWVIVGLHVFVGCDLE